MMFSAKDDYLSGNSTGTIPPETAIINEQPAIVISRNRLNRGAYPDDYAVTELMKIVSLTKKHNLQEKPEVLAGLLEDLAAKLKGGNLMAILKNPYVYGGLAAIFAGIILYKLSKKRKKK